MSQTKPPTLSMRLDSALSRFANHTVLFRKGNLIVLTFGLMFAIATMCWMIITGACLIACGLTVRESGAFMAGAALSALLFSHLFWRLGNLPALIRQPLFGLRQTGFVSWGGLAGLAAFAVSYARIHGYPLLMISDDILRGMFAAYAIGRLGCLTYGCCYGSISPGRGVRYWNPEAKVVREKGCSSKNRYPAQFFSFLQGSTLFVVLNALPYFGAPAGWITTVAFLGYPLSRAYIELYRDRRRYFCSLFTSGHLACLGAFLVGCFLLLRAGSASGMETAPLSLALLANAVPLAPVIIPASLAVLGATGFHYKRVGTW
jgi:prolipoprotein diacylglyceryltransferase